MKAQAGAIAQQQALVLVFGLSYREAAKVAGIHHRNLWSHVAAKHGSNVAPWEYRSAEVKNAAIAKVIEMVVAEVAPSAECRFIYHDHDECAFVEIYVEKFSFMVVESALKVLKINNPIGAKYENRVIYEIPFVTE
jgi:hypothetical protein